MKEFTTASPASPRAVRGVAWTVVPFYLLIAFEFFYMATPFALYLYGAYLPGLEALEGVPALAWLTLFFLPHYLPTSSMLVNSAAVAGGVLTAVGSLGFLLGAAQVYSRKLRRGGAVVEGLYRLVRHPQYSALILAGAGMLLIWPRFLLVAFFVSMLFVYRALASVEERECLAKYGQGYAEYQQQTPGFFPFRVPAVTSLAARLGTRPLWMRIAAAIATYVVGLSASLAAAFLLQGYTVRSLFAYETDAGVYVSLTPLDTPVLARLATRAEGDRRVDAYLANEARLGARFVNYVMPWEWAVPEIPMSDAEDHRVRGDYDVRRSKIVYTRAVFSGNGGGRGREVLLRAVRSEPVAEAWLDEQGRVVRVQGAVTKTFYGTVPVPLF